MNREILQVRHADLPRADTESIYRVKCPTCPEGILLVSRDPATMQLREFDHCLACGQPVQYLDIEEMRARERPILGK